jgi:hypothetical protein
LLVQPEDGGTPRMGVEARPLFPAEGETRMRVPLFAESKGIGRRELDGSRARHRVPPETARMQQQAPGNAPDGKLGAEAGAKANAGSGASDRHAGIEPNSRLPSGMTDRKARAKAEAKAGADTKAKAIPRASDKQAGIESNSRFSSGRTERKAEARAKANAGDERAGIELDSRFPAGMTERKAEAEAHANANANASVNAKARVWPGVEHAEVGSVRESEPPRDNVRLVRPSPAELWPEVFGERARTEAASRFVRSGSGDAEAAQVAGMARREPVRSSVAHGVWAHSPAERGFPQMRLPMTGSSRSAQSMAAEEQWPEDMRDLWPELPAAPDSAGVEMSRSMRQWERAMRVDREQRGEF